MGKARKGVAAEAPRRGIGETTRGLSASSRRQLHSTYLALTPLEFERIGNPDRAHREGNKGNEGALFLIVFVFFSSNLSRTASPVLFGSRLLPTITADD